MRASPTAAPDASAQLAQQEDAPPSAARDYPNSVHYARDIAKQCQQDIEPELSAHADLQEYT
jgi:hypothetical protein